jgi:hypothetical protein
MIYVWQEGSNSVEPLALLHSRGTGRNDRCRVSSTPMGGEVMRERERAFQERTLWLQRQRELDRRCLVYTLTDRRIVSNIVGKAVRRG